MNKDLLITLYDMLKYFIKKNEDEVNEYKELKSKGTSISYLNAYKIRMQKTVDNFYAIKPYYIKYNENPTKELEEEIIKKFKPVILEYYNYLQESKKKEKIETEEKIDNKIDKSELVEEKKNEKKEFPALENANSTYDFSPFYESKDDKINSKGNLKTKDKSLIERLKEKIKFNKKNSVKKKLSFA